MSTDPQILEPIITTKPVTSIRPREFFVAWSGVLTLAYHGFSTTLLRIKTEIEAAVGAIKPENPGSLWPKTTLAALRDDRSLSFEEAVALRRVCDELNEEVQRQDLTVEITQLSVVLFGCRSLERRLVTAPIPLCRQAARGDDGPPADHLAVVEATMSQFSRSRLDRYLRDLQRDGNRESHYRLDHVEATLVFDLEHHPGYLDGFVRSVEQVVPGAYCWFSRDSRHVTVRSLAT